jgi:L-methionine (R)-S-oxide reductase
MEDPVSCDEQCFARREQNEMNATVFEQIPLILSTTEDRMVKAKRIVDLLREAGKYRWVGLYEVDRNEIAVIAWSGANAPAYPHFPVTQGLSGEAVRSGETILVGNVQADARYLTTFGTTLSEMIVPIKHALTGQVLLTIDVESDQFNAFGQEDRVFFEECAHHLSSLVER